MFNTVLYATFILNKNHGVGKNVYQHSAILHDEELKES